MFSRVINPLRLYYGLIRLPAGRLNSFLFDCSGNCEMQQNLTLSRTLSRTIFQFCAQAELDFGSGQGSGQGFYLFRNCLLRIFCLVSKICG